MNEQERVQPTATARLIQLMLMGMGLLLLLVAVFLELWVMGAFAILAFLLTRMFGTGKKHRIREPERSLTLRVIAFAAQTVGMVSAAYVTELWGVFVIALVILGAGHAAAYHFAVKPP